MVAIAAIVAVMGFWRPGIFIGTPNDGHQLGGDMFDDLSGNTIECFVRGVEQKEQKNSWLYAECDIRETKDHELIVFHDWDISSLQNTVNNRRALGEDVSGQPICDLTFEQVSDLNLTCGSKIPTLEQVLTKASELDLKKPLLLEFKHLHSDEARHELLRLAIEYRDQHDSEIHFLAFIRNVERCFPESSKWMKRFEENGFRVYQVFRPKTEAYDMCSWWE